MYELLGLCVTLALMLALNCVLTLLASGLWSYARRAARDWTAEAEARATFALRVLPAGASLLVVATLMLPAYVAHEPRATDESVGPVLIVLAAFSAAGIAVAAWRVFSCWRATSLLLKDWMANARPVELPGCRLPAYSLSHHFPVIAVVGVVRPRLFIADTVFETLTAEELSAAVAHELGHVSARDNFKRAAMRVCRDVLFFNPCGQKLDRLWAEASELSADEYAARRGVDVALNLASALVKIARLAKPGLRPTLPAGVSLLGGGADNLEARVRKLIGYTERPPHAAAAMRIRWRLAWAGLFGAAVAAAAVPFHVPAIHFAAHQLIEVAVAVLQ